MGGLDKASHWLTLPTSGRIKRTPNPRLDRERVQQSWGIHRGLGKREPIRPSRPRRRIFTGCASRSSRAACSYSHSRIFCHAERPKDTSPFQTWYATYLPVKAVDTEYRPPQRERFDKRATKLRAISRASPRRSPLRERRRG